MSLPPNIVKLAEKNQDLLERIQFMPGVDNPFSLCMPEVYTATQLFQDEQIEGMFSFDEAVQRPINNKFPQYIGMILIRPDMLHVSHRFENFINDRFSIISINDVEMDNNSYWQMYKHDLYRPSTMHSRLTRAAIYIGSMCRLIVFSHRDTDRPVADHVVDNLKGKQGVYEHNTLRGDIVYNAALDLGMHTLNENGGSTRSQLQLAIDPFGAYRALSRMPEGPHVKLKYPILFYTAVGVHVPDYREIATDLSCLAPDVLKNDVSTC